jgi:hypothetical protein
MMHEIICYLWFREMPITLSDFFSANIFDILFRRSIVSFQGAGTNEDELNRVVISRCEVDMIQIKEEYETLMKRTLEKHIQVSVDQTSASKTCMIAFNVLG